eukprot:1143317-Pelagomonas_calceolata.AAC.1
MLDFTDDMRHILRGVWRDVEGVDPQETNKLATYQALCLLTTMCASQSGYLGTCIRICLNMSLS